MSVGTGRAKIKEAAKNLSGQWSATRTLWRDDVANRFEQHYLDPLMIQMRQVSEAMGHMENVINKIRNDCGESGEA